MDIEKAKKILGEAAKDSGELDCLGHYMSWRPGEKSVTLDSEFTLEELEAIVWWMTNH